MLLFLVFELQRFIGAVALFWKLSKVVFLPVHTSYPPQMFAIFGSNLSSKHQTLVLLKRGFGSHSPRRAGPWEGPATHPASPTLPGLPSPLQLSLPGCSSRPAGQAISTASDFLPLVPLQLQSITRCLTNLSTPFPSHNASQDLARSELPISPWPTLHPSVQPAPSSQPTLTLREPETGLPAIPGG